MGQRCLVRGFEASSRVDAAELRKIPSRKSSSKLKTPVTVLPVSQSPFKKKKKMHRTRPPLQASSKIGFHKFLLTFSSCEPAGVGLKASEAAKEGLDRVELARPSQVLGASRD